MIETTKNSLRLSANAIALRTAGLSSAIFTLAALAGGSLGISTALAALASLVVAGLAFRDRRPLSGRVVTTGERRQKHAFGPAAVLAALPDPVVIVDRRGLVVDANRAAIAVLPGLRNAHPLSFALRAPDVLDGLDRVVKGGKAEAVEFVERVPVERAFEVHIAPLSDEAGADAGRAGAALYFRDLTPARRLEHMRVDFVANASHELRTPLASLMGFIETLQGPARNDAAARERFLAIMREQAQRMARLIDDLLSLSRIELSVHVQPTAIVDVIALLRHMIDTLAPLARERGVEVVLEAPPGPVNVRGERDELLRVFENLIENAVKYGEGGGRVDVRVATTAPGSGGGEVSVVVRDYGPGIAPEHLPRLTERFYRVDVAASRGKGGTGLGLAIVKHIVMRHRGRLAIASDVGRGASFTVTLPALGDESQN
ncbi:ATP-binding protein [Chelatococcus sp. XZ-Ab1]|uniref:ATP-binding protein n=1 Tax=Chelatococcus sp. XZ-Ab1 TaxID=3034027 RepID=UPI0023E473EF|nr:ATP-binding protein [Chelatococcus sp. XZ-Ab1]